MLLTVTRLKCCISDIQYLCSTNLYSTHVCVCSCLFYFLLWVAVVYPHVGMTAIQNGGYIQLKTNYRVYLRCFGFLSCVNYSSFFLERMRLQQVHGSRRECLFDVANQDGDSRGGCSDLRCLRALQNFSHLGMIRRFF